MTDPTDPTEPTDEVEPTEPVTATEPVLDPDAATPARTRGRSRATGDAATGDQATHDALVVAAGDRSVFYRLSHGLTDYNIVGRWKLWFGLSGIILVIGVVGLVGRGLNMGIDFTGGTVWQVAAGDAKVADVEQAMADLGYEDVQVQEATETRSGKETRIIRVEAEATAEAPSATTDALDEAADAVGKLDVPEGATAQLDTVQTLIEDLDGPFTEDVPAELVALQKEIDGFPAVVKAAKGADAKEAAAKDSAEKMDRLLDELSADETTQQRTVGQSVTDELSKLTGTPEAQVTVDTVGPSWGKQISEKARNALVVFLLAITLFITIRFQWKMAIATVIALFHDLLIVVGLYAVFGFPVTPSTVVALLTMLGFSIYDGIVVFDRVNENNKLVGTTGKMTYTEMANRSLNQVLMRSLNTSITSLLPIVSVLVAGLVLDAATLEEFGLALFFGLLSGAYSSIFVATPLLAILKEREPANREVAAKLGQRRAAKAGDREGELVTAGAPGATTPNTDGITPRPRKQGKKR